MYTDGILRLKLLHRQDPNPSRLSGTRLSACVA